ncbi:MAG: hypothetical protein HKM89_07750 [Gemmatimonadales bacterium]|nr:hypothetical protein [Gemmatimonadales bacterium]
MAFLVGASFACYSAPDHGWFAVGMSRTAVIERFGEPDHKQTLRKTDERIWGAIESFWLEVPTGSEVEIWHYSTRIEMAGGDGSSSGEGTTELYFVDGSDTVQGIGFAPRGAVFESDS